MHLHSQSLLLTWSQSLLSPRCQLPSNVIVLAKCTCTGLGYWRARRVVLSSQSVMMMMMHRMVSS